MCVMTVTYLRSGLPTRSVLWLFVSPFFLLIINILMQLCKSPF